MPGKAKTKPKKAAKGEPPAAGRRSIYTEALAQEICERIAQGETLAKICEDDHIPDPQTVHFWRHKHPTFFDAFARARDEQMRAWADEITTLADDASADHVVKVDLDDPRLKIIKSENTITFKFDRTHVERAKLQITTRQWLMERLLSEEYGQRHKLDVNHQIDGLGEGELLRELAMAARAAEITPADLHKAITALEDEGVLIEITPEEIKQ